MIEEFKKVNTLKRNKEKEMEKFLREEANESCKVYINFENIGSFCTYKISHFYDKELKQETLQKFADKFDLDIIRVEKISFPDWSETDLKERLAPMKQESINYFFTDQFRNYRKDLR